MPTCSKCGAVLSEGTAFCGNCGTPVQPFQVPPIPTAAAPAGGGGGQVNITETLLRPFKDPQWLQKFGLGGLIFVIPLIGSIITQGYSWLYCRRVINGRYDLPEWNDWGEIIGRGLGTFVIGLAYAIVPVGAGMVLGLGAGLAGGGFGSNGMPGVGALCGVCLLPFLVLLILGFVCFFFYPMSLAMYAASGELGSAFDFSRAWMLINRNLTEYVMCYLAVFIAAVVSIVAAMIISGLVGWIPCLGWLATMLVCGAISIALNAAAVSTFGEYYRLRA